MKHSRSFRLFSVPSFWSGLGRLLDFKGIFKSYNVSKTEAEADYKAIKGDWFMVGQDINYAINEFKENEQKKKQ